MDQLDLYTNCRHALGVSLWDVIKKGRTRGVDDAIVEKVFASPVTRNDAIHALKDCGISLEDIGELIGVTRERIRQIIDQSEHSKPNRAASIVRPAIKVMNTDTILSLICTEPIYWNERGNCITSKVIEHFSEEYNQDDVSLALKKLRVRERHAKARLLVTYWFRVPESEHREWLSNELRRITQPHLLNSLNLNSPVQLSIMALNRYIHVLGIASSPSGQGIRRSYGRGEDDDWSWLAPK